MTEEVVLREEVPGQSLCIHMLQASIFMPAFLIQSVAK